MSMFSSVLFFISLLDQLDSECAKRLSFGLSRLCLPNEKWKVLYGNPLEIAHVMITFSRKMMK